MIPHQNKTPSRVTLVFAWGLEFSPRSEKNNFKPSSIRVTIGGLINQRNQSPNFISRPFPTDCQRNCYFPYRHTLYFFTVAFSTFWFKFGATLRRQAERRDSGTRQKASNLHHRQASCSISSFGIVHCASLRSASAKLDAACFSAPLSRRREVSGIRLGDRLVG